MKRPKVLALILAGVLDRRFLILTENRRAFVDNETRVRTGGQNGSEREITIVEKNER